eukprot:scaffold248998_cov13-Tisochrysis_lutea.AAC.1
MKQRTRDQIQISTSWKGSSMMLLTTQYDVKKARAPQPGSHQPPPFLGQPPVSSMNKTGW